MEIKFCWSSQMARLGAASLGRMIKNENTVYSSGSQTARNYFPRFSRVWESLSSMCSQGQVQVVYGGEGCHDHLQHGLRKTIRDLNDRIHISCEISLNSQTSEKYVLRTILWTTREHWSASETTDRLAVLWVTDLQDSLTPFRGAGTAMANCSPELTMNGSAEGVTLFL